jgi:protein-S-isoprenylcysteine O-methyltransferase Ste14
MFIFGKNLLPPLAISPKRFRAHKSLKSAAERYRKLVDGMLFAGIFAVVIFSPLPPDDPPIGYLQIVSYLLVVAATLGRLWCGIYVFGRKSKALCQDGPYSLCRNPLYGFTFLGAIGVAASCGRIVWVLGFAAIGFFYYLLVVKSEERRLLFLFGREYETYCTRVPRFLPDFRNYHSRQQLEINPHLMLRAMIKSMWVFWCSKEANR